MKRYWGSVRFFKHLILLILAALLLVPWGICTVLTVQNQSLRRQVDSLMRHSQIPQAEMRRYLGYYPDMYGEPAQRGTVDLEKTAYLTFDGGPSAELPSILDALDQYGLKATFFVSGEAAEGQAEQLRQIVRDGHTLGILSYSEDYRELYQSVEAYLEDFHRVYELIHDATGVYPQVFRFPEGSVNGYNGAIFQALISEMTRRGFTYFDWDMTELDDFSTVHDRKRAIVSIRENEETMARLPDIIEHFSQAGFTFGRLTPEVVPVVFSYPV